MHKKWMEEPAYRSAYEELEEEFALSDAVIDVEMRFPKGRNRRGPPLSTIHRGSWADDGPR